MQFFNGKGILGSKSGRIYVALSAKTARYADCNRI
jgi:hypothetical protein